jgi:peptidoglycan/LPS O-acetylase OafA/YrhL
VCSKLLSSFGRRVLFIFSERGKGGILYESRIPRSRRRKMKVLVYALGLLVLFSVVYVLWVGPTGADLVVIGAFILGAVAFFLQARNYIIAVLAMKVVTLLHVIALILFIGSGEYSPLVAVAGLAVISFLVGMAMEISNLIRCIQMRRI